MNTNHNNSIVPAGVQPRGIRLQSARVRHFAAGIVSAGLTSLALIAPALAQAATPSTSGIGAQMQQMAQEGSTTGGFVGSTAMYGAALICMVGGAWALWQSRQPQNRESGRVAMGMAGLVLAGLFATGGTWINKAANTASGANSSISSTAGTVTFGAGG